VGIDFKFDPALQPVDANVRPTRQFIQYIIGETT